MQQPVVIVASADAALRSRLTRCFEECRWQVRQAAGGAAAMSYLEGGQPEVMVLDRWFPDLEVNELVALIRERCPDLDIVRLGEPATLGQLRGIRTSELVSALHGFNREVEFMEGAPAGEQPFALRHSERAPTATEAGQDGRRVSQNVGSEVFCLPGVVGRSAGMQELARTVRLVAPHSVRVLVEGETGTGKELVVRALHALSERGGKTMVSLNCAAIPESLLEAELFGHTRGAFTGAVQARVGRVEAAHEGTLFLDEIGEMPMPLQAKMLRLLESGEVQRLGSNETIHVDVRIISATHRDLEQCVEKASFRLDLYHRLAGFPIYIPSLRERPEDVPLLSEHFLQALRGDLSGKSLSRAGCRLLQGHCWPGNVRELENVLCRAAILAGKRMLIEPEDLRIGRLKPASLL